MFFNEKVLVTITDLFSSACTFVFSFNILCLPVVAY